MPEYTSEKIMTKEELKKYIADSKNEFIITITLDAEQTEEVKKEDD